MKIINITTVFVFLFCFELKAQPKTPEFKTESIELKFTKFLNGCMSDSINTVGNNLVYNLKGQIFGQNGVLLPALSDGFSGNTNRSTPWETLSELVAAYQQKDVGKIKDLYTKESQQKVSQVFEGENAPKALEALSMCGKVKVMMGFEYKNGYYAIVETEKYGVNSNFLVLEKGKYKLSMLADKSPISWNIALYWKFKPEPFKKPTVTFVPDSISLSVPKEMVFNISTPKNWVIVFTDKLGSPVTVYAQDGGINDAENLAQQVKFVFDARSFVIKGDYTLYVLESNYPIQVVHEEMKDKASAIKIKVY
jgi:hypothetical protein